MDQHEGDPTGALSSGAATIDPTKARPHGSEPVTAATGVASDDRERAVDTIAATSDVADPEVQPSDG